MKRLRILPGAAGVIALTAMIGFVDGNREDVTDESISRGRIALVGSMTDIAASMSRSNSKSDFKPDKPIYLVELRRGNKVEEVKIDAVTGRLLT